MWIFLFTFVLKKVLVSKPVFKNLIGTSIQDKGQKWVTNDQKVHSS